MLTIVIKFVSMDKILNAYIKGYTISTFRNRRKMKK